MLKSVEKREDTYDEEWDRAWNADEIPQYYKCEMLNHGWCYKYYKPSIAALSLKRGKYLQIIKASQLTRRRSRFMREQIKEYVENNAKDFDLDGVEFCDEDFDFVEELIAKGKSLEDACDEMTQGVRDCLDY